MKNLMLTAALAAILMPVLARADAYTFDPDHSVVSFKIRHLFSKVHGTFNKFDGEISYDPANPGKSTVKATIDAKSIDTGVERRDEHLRSKDFFDVEKFPKLTFESTSVKAASKDKGQVTGKLTIHGVTKEVTLDVEVGGIGSDPWGNKKAGFTATTRIDRKDFGLGWNKTLEAGGVLVGDEVEISLEIEAMPKDSGKK